MIRLPAHAGPRMLLVLVASTLASGSPPIHAQTQPTPVRVAVYDVPPYGYSESDGSVAGISVDLWRRIAETREWRFELRPVATMDAVLTGLEQGRYDAAIGAITITAEREERVDFSYPAHRSGVAVALRRETGPLSALKAYVRAVSELGALIVLILATLVVTGSVMWLIERRGRTAERGESHVASLRDGLYWAVVTMTTVGYGDKTPKSTSGRIVATLWMFGSLVLVSLLSTSLVSRLTAERVERDEIASSFDLGDRATGAVAQSSGAEYLDGLHRRYTRYKDLPQALEALAAAKTDAVVNSVGALQYLVAKRYAAKLEMAQGLLAPAYMAIALPKGSQLKRPIDEALIKITGGPEWVSLERRFFGR